MTALTVIFKYLWNCASLYIRYRVIALGREERQVEYALACVLTEFRAGRYLAIAVRRNEKVDGRLNAQNDRDAARDRERVVAHVSAAR